MALYDPYGHVFKYLDLDNDSELVQKLDLKIPEIQNIYFNNSFESFDYSDPLFQAAYLVNYYPLYIDLIDDTLLNSTNSQIFGKEMIDEFRGDYGFNCLNVTTYGGGAEPELLGFLKFIKKKYPCINSIQSNSIDNNNWGKFKEYSFKNIVPDYWDCEFKLGKSVNLNICDIFNDDESISLINNSDVHIMQNCASDLMYAFQSVDKYVNFVYDIYNRMKDGALFIGINVPLFNILLPPKNTEVIDVRRSFHQITHNVRKSGNGAILKSPSYSSPREISPYIVRRHSYVRHFNLKSTVKYHSFVVRKEES